MAATEPRTNQPTARMLMPEAQSGADKRAEWNRYMQSRVSEPLLPETLDSVFIIVPGSSGDVVLATTVVRYIKERNPKCRVTFAAKPSNLPLVALCPGVDEAVAWPKEGPSNPRSRRLSLMRYAGRADRIVYPICDPEDMDLLVRYNFMETIWLLSGIPDGLPDGPLRLWVDPPAEPGLADRVLDRCFSSGLASQLIGEACRQPTKPIVKAIRERRVTSAGWKRVPKSILDLFLNAAYARRLPERPSLSEAAARLVILSSEAMTFPAPPRGLFEAVIRYLRSRGRVVLQNVLDVADAAPGTIPLVCSYHEFLSLRDLGVPFVGLRSGLCDIAAVSPAPMCTIYPSTFAECGDLMQATMDKPVESFGFAAMHVAARNVEMVCDSVADLDYEKLSTLLD